MPTFSISGERNGRQRTVTWTDGELSGDVTTVLWIRELARIYEGHALDLPGLPHTTHDHLSNPYVARAMMRSLFDGPTTQTGTLPEKGAQV